MLSTVLYGSDTWTLDPQKEQRLNAFHMHNLRRLLSITWQDWVTIASILPQTGTHSMSAIRTQRYIPGSDSVQDGRRSHTKGHPVWTAHLWNATERASRRKRESATTNDGGFCLSLPHLSSQSLSTSICSKCHRSWISCRTAQPQCSDDAAHLTRCRESCFTRQKVAIIVWYHTKLPLSSCRC